VPATNKDELSTVAAREYEKLRALIEGLPPDLVLVADDDDTSIKDVVGHRAHWIELFLGWYHDGQAGEEVHFPAEGYKWNELPRYNADLRTAQADLGWSDVVAMLDDRHGELMAFIESGSDGDLYGGPMRGADNAWTPGRWAEAAGPSHYRSAAKYIRARRRALRS